VTRTHSIRSDSEEARSFRQWLRGATHAEHVALDKRMSGLDLSAAEGYVHFLHINLQSLEFLRLGCRSEDYRDFDALIRRARLDLGGRSDDRVTVALVPDPAEYAHGLGIAYVVRGSRLGAQVLRSRVSAALPTAFLDHVMDTPWPHFVMELNRYGERADAAARELVLRGARKAFAVYAENCARIAGI